MNQVVFNQFASQWQTFRRPRSFLGSVVALAVAAVVIVLAVVVVLVAAVVAVPIVLIVGAWRGVMRRLPRSRADGRQNVRVRASPGVN